MLRASFLCSLLATAIIPACATDSQSDELAGESDSDGEAGKGDASGAFTYFTVTPDLRACSFDARCGGFFVARANRATTQCGRGAAMSRCYVDHIDWAGTAMPASVAKSYEDRLRNGESMILKGDLSPDALDRGSQLAATEIWVPGSATGTLDGVFVLAKDNGIRCITTPCPSTSETRLNSNRSANIDEIDFSASGATDEEINLASGQLFSDGVIVVGDRFYPTKRSKGRTASQFFTRAPVPLR